MNATTRPPSCDAGHDHVMTTVRYLAAVLLFTIGLWCALAARPAHAQAGVVTHASDACAALLTQSFLDIPDAPTTVNTATLVEAANGLPRHCRIEGSIAPNIGFQMGLPTDSWNGRLLMQGCGGFCGVLSLNGCEDMLARDFAVVFTDMGHRGRGINGALWASQNIGAVIDFGYRATHVTMVAARVLQQAFYRQPAQFTYFRGCSTGGRQAMVEAQRFPDDFDGIVSIAPPLDETAISTLHLTWSVRAANLRDGTRLIDAEDVKRVHAAAIQACDAVDGVSDGIIQNPKACRWTVADLACKAGRKSASDGLPCLPPAKLEAFQKIYGGVRNRRGERIFEGGLAPGAELGWMPYFVSPDNQPAKLLDPVWLMGEFYRYLLFTKDPGPNYGLFEFDFDTDPPRMALMETLYSATNPDLRRFKQRHGKLILVGGWDDPLIPPDTLIDYYETATRTLGGPAATTDFFRFFMVPGMDHCVGGVGADSIDYLTALMDWVERGKAPDALVSNHLKTPQTMLRYARHPLDAERVDWQRPVYAYPDWAVYSGPGDWHELTSWKRQSMPSAR